MNWLHRLRKPAGEDGTNWRHFLRAEYGNLLLNTIRARLAQEIVYQSLFARDWWERIHGQAQVPSRVVYNGVDLALYTPEGDHERPLDGIRLLLVEGSLMGGYESGLDAAVELAARMSDWSWRMERQKVELQIVGRVAEAVRQKWEQRAVDEKRLAQVEFNWVGQAPPERIPEIDRSAHLFYSADVNAACPNSVIEALACGLPVVAFDSGALPELVTPQSGQVVPYGGDPWRLEPPDVAGLAAASIRILDNQADFRRGARARAEEVFGLDAMVEGYLQALQV
jgi:glycosyltransferase involved in cell wall biosynthesis